MARRTARLSVLVAALLAGVAAAVVLPAMAPGEAPPSTASFTAQDFAWDVTGGSAHSVTIAEGGTVDFGYPSGSSTHNADFSGGPAPTSCTQTAGADSGPVPPLPAVPTGSGWSGSCRFDTPGTYRFHCDLHAFMTGTVVVVDPNAPPPTTTVTTPTRPRTPPPTTTAPPGGTTTAPPGGGGAGGAEPGGGTGSSGGEATGGRMRVSVVRRQRGAVVHGTVMTPAARWRVTVTALVPNRALARQRPRHVHDVRVASRRSRSDASGRAPFALRLNASARAALHRRGRLAVELRIAATPPDGGPSARTTATVVLRD